MKSPNYAPVYCALYPDLAEVARSHGYALAIHGSLARDFDLICIPWTINPSEPELVVSSIESEFAIKRIGEFTPKEHGRIAITVSICFGECFIDLSFMPKVREITTK